MTGVLLVESLDWDYYSRVLACETVRDTNFADVVDPMPGAYEECHRRLQSILLGVLSSQ